MDRNSERTLATGFRGWLAAALAIVFLRVVIGIHFFHEGISKVQSGQFSAQPFLEQACGPLEPLFDSLLDDPHGHWRLGVSPSPPWRPEAERTLALWRHFRDRAVGELDLDERQATRATLTYERAAREFTTWLAENEVAIVAWLNGHQRLEGFSQDGPYRGEVATDVDSLRQQTGEIAAARRAEAAPWFARVEAFWDNYEASINDLTDGRKRIQLERPWAPENSPLRWLDRLIPWFDLIVGGLLVAGLATRLAAIAGSLLLAGVVASQPFWVVGAANTFPQWIELAALLVIAAVGAGRVGGLDSLWGQWRRQPVSPEVEET